MGQIIKDIQHLSTSEDYIPDKLFFIDEQLFKIRMVYNSVFREKIDRVQPLSTLVYGGVGTGKTVGVKYLMRKDFSKAVEQGIPLYFHYLKCGKRGSEAYDTYPRVVRGLVLTMNPSYQGKKEVMPDLCVEIDLRKGLHVFIVDDIHRIYRDRDLNDLVLSLLELNLSLRNSKCAAIFITNDVFIEKRLKRETLDRLGYRKVVFHLYNAKQLFEILKHRAELSLREGTYNDDVLWSIAEWAEQLGGARLPIELLRYAAEKAEEKNKDKITEDDVEAAKDEALMSILKETINHYPNSHKIALLACIYLTKQSLNFHGEMVYRLYKSFSRKAGYPSVSKPWFYKVILNRLRGDGIIEDREVHLGRKIPTKKEISITTNPDLILKAVEETSPELRYIIKDVMKRKIW